MANSPAGIKAIGALVEELIVMAWRSVWLAGEALGQVSWPLLVSGIMNQISPAKTYESKENMRIG
ncbi:MAG: hypothetical protein LZF60_170015 [Nitrospira sp.]|nr:hypothetical protein [Nitrospira sp.]ULA59877.1 MAG: hypothetical protein LZF60_170015 [Nitrospira sp.]